MEKTKVHKASIKSYNSIQNELCPDTNHRSKKTTLATKKQIALRCAKLISEIITMALKLFGITVAHKPMQPLYFILYRPKDNNKRREMRHHL